MPANGGSVQSLDRALGILEQLATDEAGLTLTELSARTELHKTTVHRLLATLLERGFVARDDDTGRYAVGLKVLEIGQAVRRQVAPGAVVRRHLTQLRDATGETSHYAVPSGDQMVYIEKIESRRAVRIASEVGDHVELYCTALGKAYLACQPDADVERYVVDTSFDRHTEHTVTGPDEFRREVGRVRRRGFAVDDRENEPEIRCVGAAVRSVSGRAIGAVSVSAPVSRLTTARVAAVGDLVRECADSIARDMFGQVVR